MGLDARAIEGIRGSFAAATATRAFPETFYDKLFAIDPDLQGHFSSVDMRAQGAMIEQVVGLVLDYLDSLDQATPILESLGYRHRNYGVTPEHYQTAGAALVATLEQLAPAALDDQTRRDWGTVLGVLTSIMIEGGEKLYEQRRDRVDGYLPMPSDPNEIDPYLLKFLPKQPAEAAYDWSASLVSNLPKTFPIDFAGDKIVETTPLQTILDVAIQNDIPHHYICGGTGRCSTCRVSVIEGLENCLPRNQVEMQMAELKGFPPDLRLACQTRATGPIKVRRLVRDPKDVVDSVEFAREQAGRELKLAIMFVDIVDFTSFSSKNLPYDIVHALNRFFDATGAVIDRYDGYIDKYIGDGVMALFGLKGGGGDAACNSAIRAALDIGVELKRINRYMREHLEQEFRIGIGIDYGPVVVGNIGSKLRRQFTALGDVVNVASRLESKAKRRGHTVLISRAVRDLADADAFEFGTELSLDIRGKEETQPAYTVRWA